MSQTWGGGVAFVRPVPNATKARLYLITHEQFEDVVAQENWLDPGAVSLGDTDVVFDGHMYGTVLTIGALDTSAIRTITQAPDTELRAPSAAYLAHIATGLAEAHRMTAAEIDAYLRVAPGAS